MVTLREIERKDIPVINSWRKDKRLIAFLGAPFRYINQEVDESWYEDYMANRDKNVRCAIVDEGEKELIGIISLTDIDHINQNATLHFMIGSTKNRGKGIGYIASSQMLDHAFNNLNLNRVDLTILTDNLASIRLSEKLGFKKEGLLRKCIYKGGEFKDMVIMSILREEF